MDKYYKIFFSALRNIAIPIFNFLILLIGIEFYGKENWGKFINVSIWIYFVVFIAKWAGQNYIVKEFSKNPSKVYNIFYSNLIERSFFLTLSFFIFLIFPTKIAIASIVLLILIHVYNSFDALIVYHQRFSTQLITETIGFIIISGFIIICHKFDLELVIYLFSISFLIKILILTINFKIPFKKINLDISAQNIYTSIPFFLIGFSGWLSAKIDIYVVSYFFTKVELSEYQLFITAFLMLQALSAFLITPINKHLFRLPEVSIKKIKNKMAIIAFPIVLISSVFIWLLLEVIIDLSFPYYFYFVGGFTAIPTFYYIIDIFQLYRNDEEKTVVKFSFILILINIISMVFFIPLFDIFGVLISICVSQWLYLLIIKYHASKKKIN